MQLPHASIATYSSLRKRVYEVLEASAPGNRAARAFHIFLITLITANVVALVVETVEPAYNAVPAFFRTFEGVSVTVFAIEYLLRVWVCAESPAYASPVTGRIRYILSPLALLDLAAILPSIIIPVFGLNGVDLRFLRAFRLLARVGRMSRYFSGIRTLGRVLVTKRQELAAVVAVLLVLLVLASAMMYYAESAAQPEHFPSIPAAMWWSVVTLTTVGYGDVFPVTGAGRAIAGVIAVLGIGMFALPAGILGSGFLEELQRQRRGGRVCPHCGGVIEE